MVLAVGFFYPDDILLNMSRQLIVTHHAPDLDAVGATWILKTFEPKKYADAKVAYVNPGETISIDMAHELGFELHDVTHVDTGLGRFDHHQPEKGSLLISATSLVHDFVCERNKDLENDQALHIISEFITEIDHFEEIHWPDASNYRYSMMLHELIRGIEFTEPHDDDSQMQFGLKCLDSTYAVLTQQIKAREIIEEKGEPFKIGSIKCIAIETRNDDTIKVAQKQGYDLVIKKDPKQGDIRIKVRPDCKMVLKPLYEAVTKKDKIGYWFYHASGRMLINGSRKHTNQTPSPLTLDEIVALAKETLYDQSC
ncbi:MAG: hypothetical protein BroJett025_03270 [Patescibacteria group bacterium]|nr:MAG: hypothetical protein BroJett025_03270 [Patescibacteria group bacterium]